MPASSALSLSCSWPLAVSIMTQISFIRNCFFIMLHTSKPFIFGIMTSRKTRSGLSLLITSTASRPFPAERISTPCSSNSSSDCSRSIRIKGSSSTTSTLGMDTRLLADKIYVSLNCSHVRYRQSEDKDTAFPQFALDPYSSAMMRYDLPANGQPEACPFGFVGQRIAHLFEFIEHRLP